MLLATTLAACSSGGITPNVPTTPLARPNAGAVRVATAQSARNTLFADDFGSGTLAPWSVATGAWAIGAAPSGGADVSAPAGPAAMFAGDAGWSDYHLETVVRPQTRPRSRGISAIVARAIDATHGYEFGFINERTENRWSLWRDDGGRLVPLARGAYPYAEGQAYGLRIDVIGSTIAVAIRSTPGGDYAAVARVTDTTYAHGRIGLALFGGATSSFADIDVWTDGSATPSPAPVGGPPYVAPAGTQAFPSGPFDAPVNAPQIDPQSATFIASALAGSSHALGKFQFATNAEGPTDSNVPVYVARESDPHYHIHCAYYSGCPIEGADVAIPVGAIPAGRLGYTSFTDDGVHDQHLAVRNIDTNVETDLWLTPQPSGLGGSLEIGYGGAFPLGGGGVGHAGATAAGFALALGRVRPVDLLAGRIPTALFLVTPCEDGHVAPASGDDGGTSAGCPPIGAHVWLDSSPGDIAASGASPDVAVVLEAMHEFGGYIGDRCTRCTLGIALEGGLAYDAFGLTNPWIAIAALHPGETPSAPPGGVAEYHIPVATGSIDLTAHLHVIR